MSPDVVDVLHAAGVAGFVYDPAVDPPHATVKAGSYPTATYWWASCRPCWWWDEDDAAPMTTDPAVAQARADDHNRLHHQPKGSRP